MSQQVNFPLHLITVLLLVFTLGLTSCSDDDENGDDQPQANELIVNIDGSEWTGVIGSVALSGGTRQINASRINDNTSLQIFFPADTTGTFNLSTSNSITLSYSEGNVFWSDNLDGIFTLTENSQSNISGTFSVTLASAFANTDTLSLTDGSFNWDF